MAERIDIVGRTPDTGARSSQEIREDIAAKREAITETVDRLGERIHQTLDWHSYVAEHPYVAIGAAAGIGVLVSGIFKRRPSPRDRMIDALAETIEDITDRVRGNLDDVIRTKSASPTNRIKTVFTGIATAYFADLVKKKAGSFNFARGGNSGVESNRASSKEQSRLTDTDIEVSRSTKAGSRSS
jgi:hypothetical protein